MNNSTDCVAYAVGLYRGITIRNDLTLCGRIDTSDERWTGDSMSFNIYLTDKTNNTFTVIPATVEFSYGNTFGAIAYEFRSGSEVCLSSSNSERSFGLCTGDPLTLTVSDGTEATVLYDTGHGLEKAFVISSETKSMSHVIDTTGSGMYLVQFTQRGTDNVDVVAVNLVARLIPNNNFVITCAPKV